MISYVDYTCKLEKKTRTNAECYVSCQDAASDRRESSGHHSVYLGLCQVRQNRSYHQRRFRLQKSHQHSQYCITNDPTFLTKFFNGNAIETINDFGEYFS